MLDTTPVAIAIRHLISTGTPEHELLAVVARCFPELTLAELSEALQERNLPAKSYGILARRGGRQHTAGRVPAALPEARLREAVGRVTVSGTS
jgi:hypothetical protein